MDDLAKAAVPKRKPRKAHEAIVTRRRQISPDLIRLNMNSLAFVGKELKFTDHYIKLLLMPEGADYFRSSDTAQIRAEQPQDKLPITRTYTLINLDSETGDFNVNFVIHDDSGLTRLWACVAKVEGKPGFLGPGSAWGPAAEYEYFILAGDESVAPAIGVNLKRLPESTTVTAYIEIGAEDREFEFPTREGVGIHWVLCNGTTHDTELSRTVCEAGTPEGKEASWFIHGVARMIEELRRFFFVESEIPKKDVSAPGHWRISIAEGQWQSFKREFSAEAKAEGERARA